MPIRPYSLHSLSVTEEYTPGQELIYRCEKNMREELPEVLTFEEWAGLVESVWYEIRERIEFHDLAFMRGKWEQKEVDGAVQWVKRQPPQRPPTPVWIEKCPESEVITWSALWASPNIIAAGHKPLHPTWAIHELAHMVVYYEHGYTAAINETDNGHGTLWKKCYLDLLAEFLPRHAEILTKTFREQKVDI